MRVWSLQTILRRGRTEDIPAIMEIERQPGYELLVARWDEQQHHVNISRPGILYLVHDDADGRPVAFAALSGLGGREKTVLINRMIVRDPGQGIGTTVLREIMRLAFDGAPTDRLWLRVLPDNRRALHVYRSQGFREEKLLPGAGLLADGTRVDLMQMALTYDDWFNLQGD